MKNPKEDDSPNREEFRRWMERREVAAARWRWILPLLLGVIAFVAAVAGWLRVWLREFDALFSIRSDQIMGLGGLVLAIYAVVRLFSGPEERPPS